MPKLPDTAWRVRTCDRVDFGQSRRSCFKPRAEEAQPNLPSPGPESAGESSQESTEGQRPGQLRRNGRLVNGKLPSAPETDSRTAPNQVAPLRGPLALGYLRRMTRPVLRTAARQDGIGASPRGFLVRTTCDVWAVAWVGPNETRILFDLPLPWEQTFRSTGSVPHCWSRGADFCRAHHFLAPTMWIGGRFAA